MNIPEHVIENAADGVAQTTHEERLHRLGPSHQEDCRYIAEAAVAKAFASLWQPIESEMPPEGVWVLGCWDDFHPDDAPPVICCLWNGSEWEGEQPWPVIEPTRWAPILPLPGGPE